jgi:hypothetical protein
MLSVREDMLHQIREENILINDIEISNDPILKHTDPNFTYKK